MPPDVLLTQDELDFLRAMQANPQLNVRDTFLNVSVKGGPQVRELLMRLASHEQVTIEAGGPDTADVFATFRRDGELVAVLGMNQPKLFTRARRSLAGTPLDLPSPVPQPVS